MLLKKSNTALWKKYKDGRIEKLTVKTDGKGQDYWITERSYPLEIASQTGVFFERSIKKYDIASLIMSAMWRNTAW